MDKLHRYNLLLSEMDAVYHEAAVRSGLSDSVMQILYAICAEGDACSLSGICKNVGMSKQTLNSALRKMEAQGLVYLENETPRRKRVCLTAQGKALAQRTALPLMEIENNIFMGWSEEEWTTYFRLTERFTKELRKQIQEEFK